MASLYRTMTPQRRNDVYMITVGIAAASKAEPMTRGEVDDVLANIPKGVIGIEPGAAHPALLTAIAAEVWACRDLIRDIAEEAGE